MTHTPGPYVAVRFGDQTGHVPALAIKRIGFAIMAPDRQTCIATTPTTYVTRTDRDAEGMPLAELTANALLLAASSTMLALLRAIQPTASPEMAAQIAALLQQIEPPKRRRRA